MDGWMDVDRFCARVCTRQRELWDHEWMSATLLLAAARSLIAIWALHQPPSPQDSSGLQPTCTSLLNETEIAYSTLKFSLHEVTLGFFPCKDIIKVAAAHWSGSPHLLGLVQLALLGSVLSRTGFCLSNFNPQTMWEIKSWCSRRVTTLTQLQSNLKKKKHKFVKGIVWHFGRLSIKLPENIYSA